MNFSQRSCQRADSPTGERDDAANYLFCHPEGIYAVVDKSFTSNGHECLE